MAKDDLEMPDICFMAFENFIVFKNKKTILHSRNKNFQEQISQILKRKIQKQSNIKSKNFQAEMSEAHYKSAYKKIKEYIKTGEIYQMNLTHRMKAKTTASPRKLFVKVATTNPVDFLSYIEAVNFEILSASPERFIKIKNRNIETYPIKGTRPRGKNLEQDKKLSADLMRNEKEAAELNMITDLLRNDLNEVCASGTVKVAIHRKLQKNPTVWHTFSKIVGRLSPKTTTIDALLSMLPGGSIAGCPKKRAIEIIDELEPTRRGAYTGAIGIIKPNGDMDFSIAIRTIIKKSDTLYLQVGGGIVHDSTENAELRETYDKAKSFMKILR